MANSNSPTIVSASLSDEQLKKSIDSLVTHVDEAMKKMVQSTNNAVGEMEAKLKSLGNLKIDSGGSADGGASKRAKAQNEETEAVERTNAARDKQIRKNQEVKMSYDQMQSATQSAANGGKMSVIETYDMQIKLLIGRLREVRQDIDIFNAAIGSGKKTQIEWGRQGLKEANAEAERLMKTITALEGQRGNLSNLLAPQGHTIQNYVNSLQKANPELAQLNEMYRRGQSALQQQATSLEAASQAAVKSTVVTRDQNKELREHANLVERIAGEARSSMSANGKSAFLTPYRSGDGAAYIYAENDARSRGLTIEQQIENILRENARLYQDESNATSRNLENERAITQEQMKRKAYQSPVTWQGVDVTRDTIASIIASRAQLDKAAVVNWDERTSSLKTLTTALKQYQSAYEHMSAAERNSPFGRQMIADMAVLRDNIQKITSDMSRLSKEQIVNMPTRTIEEITQKMRALSAYRSGLNVDTQRKEITAVNYEYQRLQKQMDGLMQKNQSMIGSNNALTRSWNYMKNRLAFYVTVGAGTAFIKQLVDIRSQYEMNEKALGILLDSASRGTRIFNELSQMALVSPYTLIELSNAAKQLTAYDIAAKDVVDTTRRLADMASAVGVPVERLTYALGQIKAYGYLNSRDARMFANAGIPLVKQLADRYSELEGKIVSTADVYDRMKKKAIDFNDVMAVINKMTDEGGKFFDFQAKMAETLKVRLANLTLAWNNMLNEMGKDNQSVMTNGLKGLTVMFKHWRELYRVIATAITALGAYKVATIIAGIATTSSIGGSAIASWITLARGVKSAKDAVALFSLTLKSIPFTAWVTTIATLASYFVFFNNSSDGVKQKLEDIKTAFDGVRKEVETLFAEAIKTDNIGAQLTKLRDILELAETELGVTIPIKLEDVNESNIRSKLQEAKRFIDEYINFSQTFSEAAAGTKFNELMNDFGSKARSTYTNVTESINSVIVALQELSDKGQASKRDIEILNELTSGQKEDESRIEYLQRLIRLYEELGLIGEKKTEPMIEHNFFKSFFTSTWNNVEELEKNQEKNLDRLGIKNKYVFENMLKDVQDYYRYSNIAAYQFEQQVMRVAEKIDINNIPVEQRTMKLAAAINEEASQNNWNQFEKEFARQIANEKFGTTIEISDESKNVAEEDLQDWQRNISEWAKKNSIKFNVEFQTNDTEASYAKRMLQAAKDAKELWETLRRKEKQGTGSKEATTDAYNDYMDRRRLAAAAGADLSALDTKSRRYAKQAESELQRALKEELSLIDKVRSIYKDLTKEGMSHANAVERATKGWDETVNSINKVLLKNGLSKLDLTTFVGVDNPRDLVNILQKQLDKLVARGAKPVEIKELQTKIQTLNVDADKYDLTKITKGLNSELDKLKDEYELALELDANPELGDMFADMMNINVDSLPQTFGEALDRANEIARKELRKLNVNADGFDLISSVISQDKSGRWMGLDFNSNAVQELLKAQKTWQDMFKKNLVDSEKMLDDYVKKYGDYSDKMAEIESDRLEKIKSLNNGHYNEDLRNTAAYRAKKNAIEQGAERERGRVRFEEFKNSRLYITMFENLDHASTATLTAIRKRLSELKDEMGSLSPEQLKQITTQFEKIDKELMSRNPFKGLLKSARDYAKAVGKNGKAAQKDFIAAQDAYDEQLKVVTVLKEQLEQKKSQDPQDKDAIRHLEEMIRLEEGILLKKKEQLEKAEELNEKYDMMRKIFKEQSAEASKTLQIIGANLSALGEFRDQLNELFGKDASVGESALGHRLDGVIDGLSKAGDAIGKTISSLESGNFVGAASGTISLFTGVGDAIASAFGDGAARTRKLNREINDSKETVRRLNMAYEDLSRAVEKSLGTAETEARRAAIANKELELAELERQKRLEESKRSKDRDKEAIIQYEESIHTLKNEIEDLKEEVVTNLFGDDVKSAAESFVDAWVEAWRAGETTLDAMQEKMDEMIYHLVKKAMTSKIVESLLRPLYKELDDMTKEESEGGDELTVNELRQLAKHAGVTAGQINTALGEFYGSLEGILPKGNGENQLSLLQQGIQGITEDTAGALEGITNGISQQVYLHSDLLIQIRDAVVAMDVDVQIASLSQILLQLQNNYIIMQSMHSMMESWTIPSGSGIRVELLS